MKKLKTRLVLRRETIAGLSPETLGEAGGGTLTLPPTYSYRFCLPSHPFLGCTNPPIVV